MLEAIFTSIIAFISTNIDDILILTFIFTANKNAKTYKIIFGKYLGMAILTAVSILSAMGLKLIDTKYLFLLGFMPIILGVKEIISNFKSSESDDKPNIEGSVLSTAFLTIASGADNIGIYIPLFTGFNFTETLIGVIVFAVMTFLWCMLSKIIASFSKIQSITEKYKIYIIPAVYFILGIYIFFK